MVRGQQVARHGVSLSAAILAGGASRRMGRDKALLRFGGVTFLERALAAVTSVADDVLIIGDRPEYRGFGAPVVADIAPDAGALGGIVTALTVARHERALVVACDMPFLAPRLLRAMADEPGDYDALVPVTRLDHEDRDGPTVRHPLHAIYTRNCLEPGRRCVEAGRLRVGALLDAVDARELSEAWVRRHDPQLVSLMNINDPEQLEQARAALARAGGMA